MNRHERRRLLALGKAVAEGRADPPPKYVKLIEAMATALRSYRDQFPSDPPIFRLPHKELLVATCVHEVPLVCIDDTARQLVAAWVELCRTMDPENCPTLFQLGIAIEIAGIPVERVSLSELGINAAGHTWRRDGGKEPLS